MENSDILYFIHASMFVYGYFLYGVAKAIGEVGISGHMAYILKHRIDLQ
jgi:hypothetical protein